MRNDKKLAELFEELLQRMYAECVPPLDWKAARDNPKLLGKRKSVEDYIISEKRATEIEEQWTKEFKITKTERRRLAMAWLNNIPRFKYEKTQKDKYG